MRRTVEVVEFSPETLERMALSIHAAFIKSDRVRYIGALSDNMQVALADAEVMRWVMQQREASTMTVVVVQELCTRVRRMITGS